MFYREHLVFDGLWGPLVSSDPPPKPPGKPGHIGLFVRPKWPRDRAYPTVLRLGLDTSVPPYLRAEALKPKTGRRGQRGQRGR